MDRNRRTREKDPQTGGTYKKEDKTFIDYQLPSNPDQVIGTLTILPERDSDLEITVRENLGKNTTSARKTLKDMLERLRIEEFHVQDKLRRITINPPTTGEALIKYQKTKEELRRKLAHNESTQKAIVIYLQKDRNKRLENDESYPQDTVLTSTSNASATDRDVPAARHVTLADISEIPPADQSVRQKTFNGQQQQRRELHMGNFSDKDTQDVERWTQNFRNYAKSRGLRGNTMASHLEAYLSDNVKERLSDLTKDDWYNPDVIIENLLKRFGTKSQAKTNKHLFTTATQADYQNYEQYMYCLIGYYNKGWPDNIGGARATTESRERVVEKFYQTISDTRIQEVLKSFMLTYDHENPGCFELMVDFCRKAEELDPNKKPKQKPSVDCQNCQGLDHTTQQCRKPMKQVAKVDQTTPIPQTTDEKTTSKYEEMIAFFDKKQADMIKIINSETVCFRCNKKGHMRHQCMETLDESRLPPATIKAKELAREGQMQAQENKANATMNDVLSKLTTIDQRTMSMDRILQGVSKRVNVLEREFERATIRKQIKAVGTPDLEMFTGPENPDLNLN